jgi:hypothetical protein
MIFLVVVVASLSTERLALHTCTQPHMAEPGYLQDIRQLLDEWHQQQCYSFASFKKRWRIREFSYIHTGSAPCIEISASGMAQTVLLMGKEYTKALFAAAQQYTSPHQPLITRIGALYCLYCLYGTQLHDPKQKICLTMGMNTTTTTTTRTEATID